MDHLKTARVLIIDDNEAEAMLLLRALGQLGIGSIHISGDKEEDLPLDPFEGIRVVFVDMDLNVGGLGEPKQIASKTIAVFKRTVSASTPPCLVIGWTKRGDVLEVFKEGLLKEMPELKPGSVLAIPKPIAGDEDERKELVEQLKQRLEEHAPLPMLWSWEQSAHNAVTNVTALVSEVAAQVAGEKENGEWLKALSSTLKTLIQASAGPEPDFDGSPAARYLFETLNSLHLDQLERHAPDVSSDGLDSVLGASSLSKSSLTAFNVKMMASQISACEAGFRPGNAYLMKCGNRAKSPITDVQIQPSRILNTLDFSWSKSDDQELGDLYSELKRQNRQRAAEDVIKEVTKRIADRRKALKRDLLRRSRIALVETSPACDFAQGKMKMARFVAGLLHPLSESKALSGTKADYIKRVAPVQPIDFDEPCQLILNAHFIYSCPISAVNTTLPSFQFRQGPISDIQHWLAAQASRPGVLIVE